tara:strand:+ start:1714 stop:2091 length:378 start_codon:yes stop_codon:yes gene_type:complete
MDDKTQLNIFHEIIEECSCDPLTGFFRTGCCDTSDQDLGSHTVCALMTEDFLKFSTEQGNDLSTPVPQYNFPGLKEGDRWCLCANRWLQAYEFDSAPKIIAKATNVKALDIIPLEIIKEFAIDIA